MPLEQDLQALIEQRREIDRALLERHAVDMAVLFTDIVGSTAYFEQRGDIEGLALVHRHNDLLFPVVKVNHGRVIKTIGDSIMAVFKEPGDAVVCAVALQETLAKETGTASVESIRIRVGVHYGRVLKDGEDVFGDTVNTAARVASAADGDEILLSLALLESIDSSKRPATMPRRALSAKGKSAPVPIAAVAWRPQDRANAEAMSPAAQELFLIEVARGPVGLRVAAMDGEAERGTVKAYADVPLGDDEIDTLGAPFAVLAHDGGRGAYADALVERGRALFNKALPERVRARIVETKRKTVRLHLEDTLVHAPWELLHDGTDFLGCRFSVGRMVAARADAAVPPPSLSATDIVIVANPSGDLPHAEEEGRVVEKLFTAAGTKPVHASGKLTRAALLSLVERARILHFAGHVVPGDAGGFVVADGVVSASDLQAVLKKSAPALVFANACHASTSQGWAPSAQEEDAAREESGASLAQALLLAGVRHTLAPLWSVPDADALAFALRFYESALAGVPFGECARRARRALLSSSTSPLSFAGYVLYGDPRTTMPAADARLPAPGRTRSGEIPVAITGAIPQEQPRSDPAVPAPFLGATTSSTAFVPAARDRPRTDASTPRTNPNARWSPEHAPAPSTQPHSARSPMILAGVVGLLVGVLAIGALVTKPWATSTSANASNTPNAPNAPNTNAPNANASDPRAALAAIGVVPSAPVVRTGPVRISVMPFKASGSGDVALAYLSQGLAEVMVTALSEDKSVKIIERGQIDVDVGEIDFEQTKYVDPATRAALGKLSGAEIAVLGSYQPAGDALRFTARFVDVTTGEVIAAAKVDGNKSDVFGLEDKLAADVKTTMTSVVHRVRK